MTGPIGKPPPDAERRPGGRASVQSSILDDATLSPHHTDWMMVPGGTVPGGLLPACCYCDGPTLRADLDGWPAHAVCEPRNPARRPAARAAALEERAARLAELEAEERRFAAWDELQ